VEVSGKAAGPQIYDYDGIKPIPSFRPVEACRITLQLRIATAAMSGEISQMNDYDGIADSLLQTEGRMDGEPWEQL
jgi:hypothetical protein